MDSYEAKQRMTSVLIHVILIIFSIIMIVPFAWMILTALKTNQEAISVNPFYIFPQSGWHWENFGTVWKNYNFVILYKNTLLMIFFRVLCACLTDPLVWICILVLLVYGFVGFVDDYVKVTKETANAMSAKMKLFLQFTTALAAVLVTSYFTPENNRYTLTIPYFKALAINLWYFYVPLAMVVIVGASNAVNLSDGLDGLAGGLLVFAFIFFMIVAYICGGDLAQYFYIAPIARAAEVAIVCSSVVGGCVGFLWFNAPPAKVFMGDTGSLALGALLGTVAIMVKQEILLAIVGGVFVMEAVSVMIQVFWYRKTGKRFFKMAPIHHHFEQLGWPETTVVLRFWIVGLILAVIGLLALIAK